MIIARLLAYGLLLASAVIVLEANGVVIPELAKISTAIGLATLVVDGEVGG